MNKQTFLKIWKDPVLSKVISVGIVGLVTLLYNIVTSIASKKDFKTEFQNFWTTKFELWIITIVILALAIIWWTISAIFKTRPYKYDPETLELDRGLFLKIRNEVLPQDIIFQVKQSSFAENNFSSNLLFKVLEILTEERKSDFHFFNPTLDNYKTRLIKEVEIFREITSHYIFGATGNQMSGIPREWVLNQPERFKEAVKKIYDQEVILLDTYDKFIRLGKQTLKV